MNNEIGKPLPDRPAWSHDKGYSVVESVQRITENAPVFYLAPEAGSTFDRIIRDGQESLKGNRRIDEHGSAWSDRKMPVDSNWVHGIIITHDKISVSLRYRNENAQVLGEKGPGSSYTWYTNTLAGKRLAEEFTQLH